MRTYTKWFRDYPIASWATIFLLALSLSTAGCQPSGEADSDIKLNWEITPDPPKVGTATINITLRDSTEQLITGAQVKLEGNMSHPGMEPVLTTAQEIDPGKYSADMNFTMGGDWFILVESTLAGDRVVKRQIKIPGVRSK